MKYHILWVSLAACALAPGVQAATLEISAGASYSQNYYAADNYSYSRHLGGSIGYYIFATSEIEASAQYTYDRTNLAGLEDTTIESLVLSIDWVQALAPKSFPIQPYVKAGVGELNQSASGTYYGGITPPAVYDEFTVVLGAGLRIFLTERFALRAEGTTYVTDGNINNITHNFSVSAGVSLFL